MRMARKAPMQKTTMEKKVRTTRTGRLAKKKRRKFSKIWPTRGRKNSRCLLKLMLLSGL